jgi:hypothetical protein
MNAVWSFGANRCVLALLCAAIGCACTANQGARLASDTPLFIECAKSIIGAALASCNGDETCEGKIKAEHAEECKASPELCEPLPVIAGPEK